MLVHPKIGFHTGSGGNPTGIKDDYLIPLDAAGIPVVIKAVDTTAGLDDALALPNPHSVEHVLIYRTSSVRDGYDYDVPDYNKSPKEAANEHWGKHLELFPPQVIENKARVWVEVTNEIRKENSAGDTMYGGMSAADWMGEFAYEVTLLALADGYRIALFGWSSGEPEPDHWRTPGMVKFLTLASHNTELVAVSLHEYSYEVNDIFSLYPYRLGRYKELDRACDEMGIGRSRIHITEWGWTLNNVPEPERAIADIDAAMAEYTARDASVAIWYLGGGFEGIADKAQRLIKPVGDFVKSRTYDVDVVAPPTPPPPPEPIPPTGEVEIFSFEDGWTDHPESPDRVQEPNGWALNMIKQGDPLWYHGYIATGTVEAKHLNTPNNQLPPNEQLGGSNALVLHGDISYKIQAVRMATGTSLRRRIEGDGRAKISVPFQVHYQDSDSYDRVPPLESDDVHFSVLANGGEVYHARFPELKDREWLYAVFETELPVDLELRFQTSYANSRDCFLDKIEVETMTESVEPIPDDCRGKPRVDYKRVYAVIPQDATEEQAVAIFRENWRDSRVTVGGSADDAFIGDLSDKTGIFYGIDDEKKSDYIAFRDEYYPDGKIEFRPMPGEEIDPPDGDPLEGISFGYLLNRPYVYTSKFDAARDYDGDGVYDDSHEGIDADVLEATSDSNASVLAVYDGTVERSIDSSGGYGSYIRILHDYNGVQFYTRYAHLDERYVNVGDTVSRGQSIGEIGGTGGFAEHVHFNIEGIGFGESGYVVANVIDPLPYLPDPSTMIVQTSDPKVGLHASADPGDLYGGEVEYAEFRALRPGVIKVLSACAESSVRRLEAENKGAEWIVRAFLDFSGGRVVTPQQFFNDTVNDTERTINALLNQGVLPNHIWVELHNEPNLTQEGLGASWANGFEFSQWLDAVLSLYTARIPYVKYIFPGLSPGWDVPGVRQASDSFFSETSLSLIKSLDGLGVHAYWSEMFPISTAVNEVLSYSNYGLPIWITEASRNDRPAKIDDYGTEYAAFINELRSVPNVKGVTYFVASASNSLFHPECWVVNGSSKGWASKVRSILGE